MSLLSENIVPGCHGKIFGTNAKTEKELEKIKTAVLSIEGIIDMIVNFEVFPVEFTIHTSKIIKIDDVENKVKSVGYHAIPKSLFKL
ncbi:MAG: heavy-metal-associated domain-containing protein [Flavobacteriales bacterium]|nr:heavy-metal-associated domain-containing protein [Flavobacteriales bacterium]MCB9363539.1 heavy-metal-associated domain-containing protein [Flavobacteriales bacterium]